MRKINMGMVGGGPGSFIGRIHFNGAVLDGQIELVCGCFSSDYAKSVEAGRSYYLPEERIYPDLQQMLDKESKLPEGERMDFLCIATPNHLHFEAAKLALEKGFHVVSDKPMTYSTEEALELVRLVEDSGLIFALTHAYSAYPLVKEAREMIRRGDLGRIRKIISEYPQGWLSDPLEKDAHVQAAWRTDPERSGKSGCMGDIGTHALQLAEYVSGLEVSELSADLSTFVEGRMLDDDGSVLVRYNNGAKGIIYASQVSAGEENGLRLRIYGEKGGLEWLQAEPNRLEIKWKDKALEIRKPGNSYLSKLSLHNTRMPAGHPEGLIEAFANIYRNVAKVIQCRLEGSNPPEEALDFPDVYQGLRGMQFIDCLITSNNSESKWTKFPHPPK